jgi:nuclease S1
MQPGFHAMRRILAAQVCVGVMTATGSAWGTTGHQIIAELAQRKLSAVAQAQVTNLLHGATLASVASWADDVRISRPETARWHFVDIPREATHYDAQRDCAPEAQGDCVIAAIERFGRVLADRQRPESERADALKFLVHFVGDLHQPLHCIDDHDRGGNAVQVTLFGQPTNLHAVWDSGLIGHAGLTVAAYVARLEAVDVDASGTPILWAEEAHRAAIDHAYVIPADHHLDDTYYAANRPVLDVQLSRGGTRLATLLNEILGQ